MQIIYVSLRELAKSFLNNLYGKISSNTRASFKQEKKPDFIYADTDSIHYEMRY